MPDDGHTAPRSPRWLRVLGGSAALGVSAAAAVAAIVTAVALWARNSGDVWLDPPVLAPAIAAIIAAACVLAALTLRIIPSKPWHTSLIGILLLGAFGATAWGIWWIWPQYKARAQLPLVDISGSVPLVAVTLSAAGVAVLSAAITNYPTPTDIVRRITVCTFVITLSVVLAGSTFWVSAFRTHLWQPELTAAPATPAPLPHEWGPVRYRLQPDPQWFRDITPAGNGFLVHVPGVVTAYDGPTGSVRWRINMPDGVQVAVVQRSPHDSAGVAVMVTYGAMIAVDASTGTVIWRRQYQGELTAVATGIDALGMTIFRKDGTDPDRTQLYSLDPATGALRWHRTSSCSDPSTDEGTRGQFQFRCGNDAVIDAYTGAAIDTPDRTFLSAGIDDVYVASSQRSRYDPPRPDDATTIIDPSGSIIDQVPHTFPVSKAKDGLLLLWAGGDTWLLRNYRTHQSTPVPLHLDVTNALVDTRAAWLDHDLAITTEYSNQPVYIINPDHASDTPLAVASPCPRGILRSLQPVAGAVTVACGLNQVVGIAATPA